MIDGPRDADFDAPFARQFWSMDWGGVHVNGLDFPANENGNVDADGTCLPTGGMVADGRAAGLGIFDVGDEQRTFFEIDDNPPGAPPPRWRIAMPHAGLTLYDSNAALRSNLFSATCCGADYHDFCDVANTGGIDLVLVGHSDEHRGLTRYFGGTVLPLSWDTTGNSEGFVYSFGGSRGGTGAGYSQGYYHIRAGKKAIVVSRISVGGPTEEGPDENPMPAYLKTDGGRQGLGLLYECHKYVPGLRSGCQQYAEEAECVTHEEPVRLRLRDDNKLCSDQVAAFANAAQLSPNISSEHLGWNEHHLPLGPCCHDWWPDDKDQVCTEGDIYMATEQEGVPRPPSVSLGVENSQEPAIYSMTIQSCNKRIIDERYPWCLHRQIIPIVSNLMATPEYPTGGDFRPFVHNESLLTECALCLDSEGRAPTEDDFAAAAIVGESRRETDELPAVRCGRPPAAEVP